MNQGNVILNVDCLIGMKDIPDESIDCIVTDPPYRLTSHGSSGTMSGYWTTEVAKRGKVFEHNDIEIEDYLPELYRVLKPETHCYIMCNNLNLPHFFDVISKSKFHFVKLLVWDKVKAICGRYYMGRVEHIFLLRKGNDRPINDCGTVDILTIPNVKPKDKNGNNLHDSAKPVALFQLLIKNSTNKGDIVLDPFMGSGTTAIACINTERKYLGFEKDKGYWEVCDKRIKSTFRQGELFER